MCVRVRACAYGGRKVGTVRKVGGKWKAHPGDARGLTEPLVQTAHGRLVTRHILNLK